ncbi:MAG: hypothetical protein AABZ10_11695 [Nitrospirota bacterium]
MKKIIIVLSFSVLAMSAVRADADPFKGILTQNEFTTAESIDPGMTQTGIHFTLGDNYRSYYPAFRYGLGAFFEVGVKFGVTTVDVGPEDKLATLVGVDMKYQLVKETEGIPIDMAVDLGFDTHIINGGNLSELTFATIFSKGFPLTERGYKFTPYAGIEMSSTYGSSLYLASNETNVYVFGGMEWKISQKFMIVAEIKAGDIILGGAGIRFEY